MQRLASLLKVRPEEIRLVALVAGLFMCIQAGQGMGDNAASALFFLRFGVDFLPYMYLFLGGLTFVTTLAYSAGLGRFEKGRFLLWLMAGSALLLVIERIAILLPVPALYPVLWLTVNGLGMILGTFVWNVAGEVCDARQAKRLFPLFTSAGILGSVLGNAVTGVAARLLGTDNLLILYAALLVLALVTTRAIARGYFKVDASPGRSRNLLADLRAGYDFVRGSELMRLIAYASVLFSILFFAIAFPFSKIASASFPDEAGVAGFLGLFSSVTTAATFLVSLLLANRVYSRFGIVNSVLLMPIIYVVGFLVFLSSYDLPGAVAVRFGQLVVLSGVAGTAWNALFNVVPSRQRGQVLAFENGVPSQIGVALSGVLLVLGERVLSTQQIFWIGIPLALFSGYLVWRMRSAYGAALIAALRAGRVEVFNAEAGSFAGFRGDPAAVRVAVTALHDPKPGTRRLGAEILARMQADAAVPELIDRLTDADAGVRAAALRALGGMDAIERIPSILASLDDPKPQVRTEALNALGRLRPEPTAALLIRLEPMLDDPDERVRIRAAIAQIVFGRPERALATLRRLAADSSADGRIAALDALGEAAPSLAAVGRSPEGLAAVLTGLDDSAAPVRRAACAALIHFNEPRIPGALAERLSDDDAGVRAAAAVSLRGLDPVLQPGAQTLVLHVLEAGDGQSCDAALDALAPRDPRSLQALQSFTRRSITRVHGLRSHALGLQSQGRAVRLLRQSLQARAAMAERQLVKAVGQLGDPRAMRLVGNSLHAKDAEARAAALEALETLGVRELTRDILELLEESAESRSGEAASVISALLDDPGPWMCALAARAIPELGLSNFMPRLQALRTDPRPLVRQAAEDALIQMNEETSMETLQTVSTLERILLLREVPMFADLAPEDLEQVAGIASEQWHAAGDLIGREGEPGESLFIIVTGQVQVVTGAGGGSEKLVATRGPGEFVGEMAVIDSAPRSAGLRAAGEVRVLSIEGEAFKAILRDRPDAALAVLRGLSRRIREMLK